MTAPVPLPDASDGRPALARAHVTGPGGVRRARARRHRAWWRLVLPMLLASLLFTAWPGLDLAVSQALFEPARGFWGQQQAAVLWVHAAVPWAGRAMALAGLLVWLSWARGWGWSRQPRRWTALGLAMLLGVGLLVNGVFKEHWGRPRPLQLAGLGGQAQFVPAWQLSSQCRTNCSFVSGHAATGFALMGVGLMAAPRTRRRWCRAGIVAGTVVGAGRVLQGGHFVSDIVFAGLLMAVCLALLRRLWLQRRLAAWPSRRRPQRARMRPT